MPPKEFHFYNEWHIGDNILNLKYFLYLSHILKKRGDTIFYYYNTTWCWNRPEVLLSYIDTSVVTLKPLDQKPSNAIQLWQGILLDNLSYLDFELYFEKFYGRILKFLQIEDTSITTNIWLPEPFLIPIYEKLDEKFKNIDILILNNQGNSGQIHNTSQLNQLAIYLSTHFNIVTAVSISDSIKSANSLSLQEIGAVSTHASYVISTCSGPQIPCFNKQTRDHVKKWFFVSSGMNFHFVSIDHLHSVNNISPIRDFFDNLIANRPTPAS